MVWLLVDVRFVDINSPGIDACFQPECHLQYARVVGARETCLTAGPTQQGGWASGSLRFLRDLCRCFPRKGPT